MDKHKFISDIQDLSTLSVLLQELLGNLGLDEPTLIERNVYSVEETSLLVTRKIHFHFYLSEMNGKVQMVADKINKYKESVDEFYIVTTHKKQSDYFKKFIYSETGVQRVRFWNNQKLIDLIDTHNNAYWGVSDQFLKKYEEHFQEQRKKDINLRSILKDDKDIEKLLNAFVEPKIFILTHDEDSKKLSKKKLTVDDICKTSENIFLSGEAGTGKTTLLKEFGSRLIKLNERKTEKYRVIPVFITTSDLFENSVSIEKALYDSLSDVYNEADYKNIFSNYKITLLIDSIDEFEVHIRETLLAELNQLHLQLGIRYIVATRNFETLLKNIEVENYIHPFITNFDQRQAKKYLDNFFRFDIIKSEKLWQTLSENNILDKVPMTALTISLISLLYDEKEYEVPATVTDVYDNFNAFLLGRTNVKSNLEFLNINIKERILSVYALCILEDDNRERLGKDEFIEFIRAFFSQRSITIEEDVVPELISSLTDGTGILFVDENGFVTFKHDQFMEYYASREIFNYRRDELEHKLIDRFIDFNWQSTGIFYAGRTKDMPEFLGKVIGKVGTYSRLNEFLLSVSGLGYLMQSLWLTDSKIRAKGVIRALDTLLLADSQVKQLASDKFPFFAQLREIDIALSNLTWFFKHFDSITLKDPIKLAFDEIERRLPLEQESSFGNDRIATQYQLFCLAATANSGIAEDETLITILFDQDNILNTPFLVLLFDAGLSILEAKNRKQIRENSNFDNRFRRFNESIRFYLETPAEKLRLSAATAIRIPKNVEIYTEGTTDAEIIDHAFNVLNEYREPYWSVRGCEVKLGIDSGGANHLGKLAIQFAHNELSQYDSLKTLIFLFDNDSKGHQEWNGIKSDKFIEIDDCTKKHVDRNIYIMKLPIPVADEYSHYIQQDQAFKFFAIEHYFPLSYLKEKEMVSETPIPKVYSIKDRKTKFAEEIRSERNPEIFENFSVLFEKIDELVK